MRVYINKCAFARKQNPAMAKPVEKVRVLVCGDDDVGKDGLIEQFTSGKREKRTSTLTTIGVDVQTRVIRVGERDINLQIWTTVGQERFQSMPSKYFNRAEGIILVYDVTKRETFDFVQHWLRDIMEIKLTEKLTIALVGNRSDQTSHSKNGDFHQGQELASSYGTLYFETNSESGENVEELFEALTTEILDKKHEDQEDQKTAAVTEVPPLSMENSTSLADMATSSSEHSQRSRCF